jgi:hypothetical protein
VTARMLAWLSAARREALLAVVTIDLDTTEVEVYGRRKQGVAYNYQGQRCGRPHVATWAEADVALVAELLVGNEDPRRGALALLRRALAALPTGVREVKLRADGGYFAVDLAVAAYREEVGLAIGLSALLRCGASSTASHKATGSTRSAWTAPRSRWPSTARTGGPRRLRC